MENKYVVKKDLVSPHQFKVACNQHFRLLVIITLIFGVIGFALSMWVIKPQYQAKTEVLIQPSKVQNSDQQAAGQLVYTYKDMVTNSSLLKSVAQKVSTPANGYNVQPSQLSHAVKANSSENSQILNITVNADNPRKAQVIANTLTTCLQQQSMVLMHHQNVKIVSRAQMPGLSLAYKPIFIIIFSALIGLIMGLIFVLINAYNHPYVYDSHWLNEELGLRQLGALPYSNELGDKND